MFDIIVAFLAVVGLFAILTGAFLMSLHMNNLATIEMNRRAAEREKLAADNRVNQ